VFHPRLDRQEPRFCHIEGPEDFYDNKHLNSDLICVNFTDLSDDEFYTSLYEANLALLENYHNGAHRRVKKQLYELYGERDTTFQGFRHSYANGTNLA